MAICMCMDSADSGVQNNACFECIGARWQEQGAACGKMHDLMLQGNCDAVDTQSFLAAHHFVQCVHGMSHRGRRVTRWTMLPPWLAQLGQALLADPKACTHRKHGLLTRPSRAGSWMKSTGGTCSR